MLKIKNVQHLSVPGAHCAASATSREHSVSRTRKSARPCAREDRRSEKLHRIQQFTKNKDLTTKNVYFLKISKKKKTSHRRSWIVNVVGFSEFDKAPRVLQEAKTSAKIRTNYK